MPAEKAQCQCDLSCKNPPEPKAPFCKYHMKKGCTRIAPVTKATPSYAPWKYNTHKGIQESLNCYAYAMDYLRKPKKCTKEKCDVSYPQPGRASGYPVWSDIPGKRCPDVIARIKGDVPHTIMSAFTKKCPRGMRKIVAVTDPKEDYHFYRQDADGYWSHKPGATKVKRLDTTGRPIYDPALAARDNKESNLNYKNFCGYMCIPVSKNIHLSRSGGKRSSKRSSKTQRKKH